MRTQVRTRRAKEAKCSRWSRASTGAYCSPAVCPVSPVASKLSRQFTYNSRLRKATNLQKKMMGSGLVQSTLSALHVDQAESSLQLQYCCEIMGNPFISTAITICQCACMRPHAWAWHAVLLVSHPAVLGSKTHFGFHGLDCRGDSVLSLKFRDLSLLGSQVDSLLYTPWGRRVGMDWWRDAEISVDLQIHGSRQSWHHANECR